MLSVYEELRESARRQILGELRGGPRSVNDLARVTGLRQPNVSNHLARMRAKGLVRFSKMGRNVYYTLASPEIEMAVNAVLAIKMGCCQGMTLCPLVDRFTHAAVAGDEAEIGEILDEAFRSNAGLVDIYQDLFAAAMQKVGALYEAGIIDSAEEHLATEATLRAMSRTVQMTCPAPPNGRACVLGNAPQSWHVLGLRMAADVLRIAGWKALYLGANVPIACFLKMVRCNRPQLVLTSCCDSDGLAPTLELISELRRAKQPDDRYLIGAGGRLVGEDPEPFCAAGADLVVPSLRAFACKLLPDLEQ
jgi:methanogenic corrinoid protein MtbC1